MVKKLAECVRLLDGSVSMLVKSVCVGLLAGAQSRP